MKKEIEELLQRSDSAHSQSTVSSVDQHHVELLKLKVLDRIASALEAGLKQAGKKESAPAAEKS